MPIKVSVPHIQSPVASNTEQAKSRISAHANKPASGLSRAGQQRHCCGKSFGVKSIISIKPTHNKNERKKLFQICGNALACTNTNPMP